MKASFYGTDSSLHYMQFLGYKGMVEILNGEIIISALHKETDFKRLRKQIEYSSWEIRKIQERERWGSHKYTYFTR